MNDMNYAYKRAAVDAFKLDAIDDNTAVDNELTVFIYFIRLYISERTT